MAISSNNVQNVKFLRNATLYETREAARTALENNKTLGADGTALLARYGSGTDVKTLAGLVWSDGTNYTVTIIDVEGGSSDVEKLRDEINAKLGTSFISSSNTVEANLTALSGTSADGSGVTSVWGAKAYANDLIGTLDGGVTAETGSYVVSVSEVDGKISGTTAELPSSADTAVAKKFVTAVAEDKGQIVVSRGEISSSAETMVLTDNADGGVNFEVNIDGVSIVQDTTSKKLKVADTALTQYYGDENTVHAEVDSTNNTKTFSTLLKIVKNANPSETEVKEEYFLADADGTAITGADTIKIYKDSHIVSITYITDSGDTHYQNLEYVYIDASGATKTAYVDISSLVLEAEFASGLTIENHVARGVVDPQSELDSNDNSFLTVGADGFKIDGIKNEIDRKLAAIVDDLDATVTGATSGNHVTITIDEVDGKLTQSGLTIEENDIASASDLAALSAKTITDVKSANGSVTVTPANAADGTKEIDLATDASKIKMSGLTDTTGTKFSGLTENSSVTAAINKIITNDGDIASEIEELRKDIDTVSGDVKTISGDVDTIKEQYISGVSVNSHAVTVANHVAPISVVGATEAMTATNTEAIVVDTDANGNITLGLANIDCGTYN